MKVPDRSAQGHRGRAEGAPHRLAVQAPVFQANVRRLRCSAPRSASTSSGAAGIGRGGKSGVWLMPGGYAAVATSSLHRPSPHPILVRNDPRIAGCAHVLDVQCLLLALCPSGDRQGEVHPNLLRPDGLDHRVAQSVAPLLT